MGEIWGEFGPNPKEMQKVIDALSGEVADLILRVKNLEEQVNQTAIITTTPIGGFQPRNRRFNT